MKSIAKNVQNKKSKTSVDAISGKKLKNNLPIDNRDVEGSLPSRLIIEANAEYLDAIRSSMPALASIFVRTPFDITEKPLAEHSTEELIAEIDAGRFVAEIAYKWRVPSGDLNKWIEADPDRLAQAKSAQKNQAALWDWLALQVLFHAPSNRVEIMRAGKIAQHCRWRAGVFNRDEYGQNIKVTPVDERGVRELTTKELTIIACGGVLPG